MTPKWLSEHATIYGSCTYKPNCMEILAGTDHYQHVLQVQLVPPGVLTNDDSQSLTVTMTIAMNITWADANDHDPSFGISDGERVIGFIVVDKGNYANSPPCYSAEGDNVNDVLTNPAYDNSDPSPNSPQGYSSEVKIQIKPGEKWGSCHTEHAEGFVFIENYQHDLDLTKGLYLDIYRNSRGEIYRIEYITVYRDHKLNHSIIICA